MSFTLETIELCRRWYPINNGVLFLLALLIIFFADWMLSEIGFSNRTGILFFNNWNTWHRIQNNSDKDRLIAYYTIGIDSLLVGN